MAVDIVDGPAVLLKLLQNFGPLSFGILQQPNGSQPPEKAHNDFSHGFREKGGENNQNRHQGIKAQTDIGRHLQSRNPKKVSEKEEEEDGHNHKTQLLQQKGINRDCQAGAVRQAPAF